MIATAGTITSWSDSRVFDGRRIQPDVRLFQVSYVTHASDGTFTASTPIDITGWIIGVETDPGATAPTTLYDVVLNNDNGRDIMGGSLTDRSATATEYVMPSLNSVWQKVFNHGPLSIQVTAAGNSKTAEILIYYEV